MSGAKDKGEKRGWFRRSRPLDLTILMGESASRVEPNASAGRPPKRTADMFAKNDRQPSDAWSSSAWAEDEWDDDWSDPNRKRASVRPAADPKREDVDAWLESGSSEFADITREMQQRWVGRDGVRTPIAVGATWDDPPRPEPGRSTDAPDMTAAVVAESTISNSVADLELRDPVDDSGDVPSEHLPENRVAGAKPPLGAAPAVSMLSALRRAIETPKLSPVELAEPVVFEPPSTVPGSVGTVDLAGATHYVDQADLVDPTRLVDQPSSPSATELHVEDALLTEALAEVDSSFEGLAEVGTEVDLPIDEPEAVAPAVAPEPHPVVAPEPHVVDESEPHVVDESAVEVGLAVIDERAVDSSVVVDVLGGVRLDAPAREAEPAEDDCGGAVDPRQLQSRSDEDVMPEVESREVDSSVAIAETAIADELGTAPLLEPLATPPAPDSTLDDLPTEHDPTLSTGLGDDYAGPDAFPSREAGRASMARMLFDDDFDIASDGDLEDIDVDLDLGSDGDLDEAVGAVSAAGINTNSWIAQDEFTPPAPGSPAQPTTPDLAVGVTVSESHDVFDLFDDEDDEPGLDLDDPDLGYVGVDDTVFSAPDSHITDSSPVYLADGANAEPVTADSGVAFELIDPVPPVEIAASLAATADDEPWDSVIDVPDSEGGLLDLATSPDVQTSADVQTEPDVQTAPDRPTARTGSTQRPPRQRVDAYGEADDRSRPTTPFGARQSGRGAPAAAMCTTAGTGLVAVAALRMLAALARAIVHTGRVSTDIVTGVSGASVDRKLDVANRIGIAFSRLGIFHGLTLVVGVVLLTLPAFLGDEEAPRYDSRAASLCGIAGAAGVLGIVGGLLGLRAELTGVHATAAVWTAALGDAVAISGTSLVALLAVVHAIRTRADQ